MPKSTCRTRVLLHKDRVVEDDATVLLTDIGRNESVNGLLTAGARDLHSLHCPGAAPEHQDAQIPVEREEPTMLGKSAGRSTVGFVKAYSATGRR
jgi:hypothetical protein